MSSTVRDNPDQSRYEIYLDDVLAGFAEYQRTEELVVFTHTEIKPEFEGQGVGGTLVREALDHVRSLGVKALPVCPFVQAWMQRHPEYAALDYRARG